jgi:hypothetical protein
LKAINPKNMTKKKPSPVPKAVEAVIAPEQVAPADIQPPNVPARKSGDYAEVVTAEGAPVRRYTYDDHGPDFAQLAAQYAGKIGGSVR